MQARAILPALVLVAAACTPAAGPTAPPSVAPSVASTPSPTSSPSPLPAPTASPVAALDLAHVAVAHQSFARIDGKAIAVTTFGDGSGRILVASQEGRIWIVTKDGAKLPTPFLDIRARVGSGDSEQGLLGIAVHPGFPADPRIFVDYTDTKGDTVVSSFTVDPATPDEADPHRERIILGVDQPYVNHNGGDIHFGPDGFLYIGLGDGGDANDPHRNGQALDRLLGKILRIDVDHADGLRNYAIPAGNPFVGRTDARPEIWLVGVRNPWRYSFDPANGDLWIGDVGQDIWEEVDVVRGGVDGLNLGWNVMEAGHCFLTPSGCDQTGLTLPIAEYSHAHGCAIIGGPVYRGAKFPFLDGAYLFTDFCQSKLMALDASAAGPLAPVEVGIAAPNTSAFGVDESGELLEVTLDGLVERLVAISR